MRPPSSASVSERSLVAQLTSRVREVSVVSGIKRAPLQASLIREASYLRRERT